jgi:hypothetical protein
MGRFGDDLFDEAPPVEGLPHRDTPNIPAVLDDATPECVCCLLLFGPDPADTRRQLMNTKRHTPSGSDSRSKSRSRVSLGIGIGFCQLREILLAAILGTILVLIVWLALQ